MSKLLTREEACEYLGISMDTLGRMIARGELEAFKVGRRAIRISEDGIQKYLQMHALNQKGGDCDA